MKKFFLALAFMLTAATAYAATIYVYPKTFDCPYQGSQNCDNETKVENQGAAAIISRVTQGSGAGVSGMAIGQTYAIWVRRGAVNSCTIDIFLVRVTRDGTLPILTRTTDQIVDNANWHTASCNANPPTYPGFIEPTPPGGGNYID